MGLRVGCLLIAVALPVCSTAAAETCPSVVWTARRDASAIDAPFRRVVTIDANRDGKLDIAGLSSGSSTSYDTVQIWIGNGDGSFNEPTTLLTATTHAVGAIRDLAVSDVSSDGYPDLLVLQPNLLRIYPATSGGLGTATQQSLANPPSRISVGNFDMDSGLEMMGHDSSSVYLYDQVNGSFTQTRMVAVGSSTVSLVTADFDRNGMWDIATAKRTSDTEGVVEVRLRTQDGSSIAPMTYSAGSFPTHLASADFNGDQYPDLAVANWYDGTVTVLMNNGAAAFSASTFSADLPRRNGDTPQVLAGDANGDGTPDLVVPMFNDGWSVATFVGAGNGTFRTPTHLTEIDGSSTVGSFGWVTLGDFDADGDGDLAGVVYQRLAIASSSCATQVTLTPESPMITAGADARMLVNVSGFGTATAQPYGTVTLYRADTSVGTTSLSSSGSGTLSVSGLPAGDHSFTASFGGNGELSPGTSAVTIQKVTNSATQTVIRTPATPPVYGADWPVTVSVEGSGFGSEWVELSVDGTVGRIYTPQVQYLRLTPGTHTLTAKFYGTQFRPASQSATVVVTAQKATPTLRSTCCAPPRREGTSSYFYAQVQGPAGTQPTGAIQVYLGATLLATQPLYNGTASPYFSLPRGTHTVRAVYTGDAYFDSASMDVTVHVVRNVPIPMEARALTSQVEIVYAMPDGASYSQLFRRVAGGAWGPATGFDYYTGLDSSNFTRGVVYDYQLQVRHFNGALSLSNVDSVILFSNDPLRAGITPIMRAHFTEIRDAVNLMRTEAGLPAFAFESGYDTWPGIRAKDVNALRTAVTEARSGLRMFAPVFDEPIAAGAPIRATHVQQLRDLTR